MIYINAFVVCGLLCVIGQILYDNTTMTYGHITSIFVVVGCVLDVFQIYDLLLNFAGMGASIPITSFGHSLMHGAMQQVTNDGIIGIATGMFDMVAPGITAGIFFAFISAVLFKSKA